MKALILIIFCMSICAVSSYASEPEEGVLALKTDPSGAKVYINGQLLTNSTPVVLRLAPGRHEIRAEKQWLSQQTSVIIENRATVVKTMRLKSIVGQTLVDSLSTGDACAYCPQMVVLPAGQFKMGDIQSEVTVKIKHPFAMGKYEVTFVEYDAFAQATGQQLPADNGWGRGVRPVINVDWHQATAYAEWLSKQTGRTYRLPTEAEWEYAARAGTQTDYWWGTRIGRGHANCYLCGSRWSGEMTITVGAFEPNPFGLHDMLGNVMEWTCSQYAALHTGKVLQCAQIDSPAVKYTLRGTGWGTRSDTAQINARFPRNKSSARPFIGFRVVRLFPANSE